MPTFSRNLEQSLHRALALANERHHEYATLEHLLLALVDDQDAADVMRACNADIDELRRNMVTYVESELEELVTDGAEDAKPTAGLQRVIQRAVIHVQSSGGEEVTGANLLVAIFAERESHAAYFLQEQEMTRADAANYISHGIANPPGQPESRPNRGVEDEALARESDPRVSRRFLRRDPWLSTVSFSTALEDTLRRALADANARGHGYATLVHLVRALIEDLDASAVMKARQVDLDVLKADLVRYLDNEMNTLATGDHRDSQPTAGVQRVVTRAVDHVRSLRRGTVTGEDLLLAMFDEKDSPAVWLLGQHGMSR